MKLITTLPFFFLIFKGFYQQQGKAGGMNEQTMYYILFWNPALGENLLTVSQVSDWQTCWSCTAPDCMQGVSAQRPCSRLLLAHLQVQVFWGNFFLFSFLWTEKNNQKQLWRQLNGDQNEHKFQLYKQQKKRLNLKNRNCQHVWRHLCLCFTC